MPYKITWDGQGFVKRFSGFVSSKELVQSNNDCFIHPFFDHAKYIIQDFSKVERASLNGRFAEEAAVMRIGASRSNPGIHVAYIDGDPSIADFVDMLHSPPYNGTWETRFFHTISEAMEWVSQSPKLISHPVPPPRLPDNETLSRSETNEE